MSFNLFNRKFNLNPYNLTNFATPQSRELTPLQQTNLNYLSTLPGSIISHQARLELVKLISTTNKAKEELKYYFDNNDLEKIKKLSNITSDIIENPQITIRLIQLEDNEFELTCQILTNNSTIFNTYPIEQFCNLISQICEEDLEEEVKNRKIFEVILNKCSLVNKSTSNISTHNNAIDNHFWDSLAQEIITLLKLDQSDWNKLKRKGYFRIRNLEPDKKLLFIQNVLLSDNDLKIINQYPDIFNKYISIIDCKYFLSLSEIKLERLQVRKLYRFIDNGNSNKIEKLITLNDEEYESIISCGLIEKSKGIQYNFNRITNISAYLEYNNDKSRITNAREIIDIFKDPQAVFLLEHRLRFLPNQSISMNKKEAKELLSLIKSIQTLLKKIGFENYDKQNFNYDPHIEGDSPLIELFSHLQHSKFFKKEKNRTYVSNNSAKLYERLIELNIPKELATKALIKIVCYNYRYLTKYLDAINKISEDYVSSLLNLSLTNKYALDLYSKLGCPIGRNAEKTYELRKSILEKYLKITPIKPKYLNKCTQNNILFSIITNFLFYCPIEFQKKGLLHDLYCLDNKKLALYLTKYTQDRNIITSVGSITKGSDFFMLHLPYETPIHYKFYNFLQHYPFGFKLSKATIVDIAEAYNPNNITMQNRLPIFCQLAHDNKIHDLSHNGKSIGSSIVKLLNLDEKYFNFAYYVLLYDKMAWKKLRITTKFVIAAVNEGLEDKIKEYQLLNISDEKFLETLPADPNYQNTKYGKILFLARLAPYRISQILNLNNNHSDTTCNEVFRETEENSNNLPNKSNITPEERNIKNLMNERHWWPSSLCHEKLELLNKNQCKKFSKLLTRFSSIKSLETFFNMLNIKYGWTTNFNKLFRIFSDEDNIFIRQLTRIYSIDELQDLVSFSKKLKEANYPLDNDMPRYIGNGIIPLEIELIHENITPEAISQLEDYDLYTINNDKHIYYKKNNNTYRLNIDQKMFRILFPKDTDFFHFAQGNAGDCYFIAPIISFIHSKTHRIRLLNCFYQTRDNSLIIKCPNNIAVKFEKSENQLFNTNLASHFKAALGWKLFEEYFSCIRRRSDLEPIKLYNANELHTNNLERTLLSDEERIAGGCSTGVMNFLGFSSSHKVDLSNINDQFIIQRLLISVYRNHLLMCLSSKDNCEENYNYGIYNNHAYSIYSLDIKDGQISNLILINPHNSAILIKIPFKKILQDFNYLHIFTPKTRVLKQPLPQLYL